MVIMMVVEMGDGDCMIGECFAYHQHRGQCLRGNNNEPTWREKEGIDSQRSMRSVCWRPLIASSMAALATSSCGSESLKEGGDERKLKAVAQDTARTLRWPLDELIGNEG
jgi:hypothetical protein